MTLNQRIQQAMTQEAENLQCVFPDNWRTYLVSIIKEQEGLLRECLDCMNFFFNEPMEVNGAIAFKEDMKRLDLAENRAKEFIVKLTAALGGE